MVLLIDLMQKFLLLYCRELFNGPYSLFLLQLSDLVSEFHLILAFLPSFPSSFLKFLF